MKFPIPFLPWTGRAALEIEIPDSTEERFRLKVALEIAVRDRASLVGAQLRSYRADLFDVLLRAPKEVAGLLAAVREGRIDGSTYSGECACLVGTIANVRGCNVDTLDYRDSSRPIEQWFMMIKPGHKPKTHIAAKMAERWITEFQALTGQPEPAEVAA